MKSSLTWVINGSIIIEVHILQNLFNFNLGSLDTSVELAVPLYQFFLAEHSVIVPVELLEDLSQLLLLISAG